MYVSETSAGLLGDIIRDHVLESNFFLLSTPSRDQIAVNIFRNTRKTNSGVIIYVIKYNTTHIILLLLCYTIIISIRWRRWIYKNRSDDGDEERAAVAY